VFQRSAKILGASLVALLAIHRYVAIFKDSLIDDAFIQLQYAQTLAMSGTWGFFRDRLTNTATSPLNVELSARAGLIAPSMVDAIVWLTALEMLAILIFFLLAARKLFDGYAFGAIAFVACVGNPLVVSTIGLEGVLFITWISAAIYFFAAGRWSALAVCLALLTLTRADGVGRCSFGCSSTPQPPAPSARIASRAHASVPLPLHGPIGAESSRTASRPRAP